VRIVANDYRRALKAIGHALLFCHIPGGSKKEDKERHARVAYYLSIRTGSFRNRSMSCSHRSWVLLFR